MDDPITHRPVSMAMGQQHKDLWPTMPLARASTMSHTMPSGWRRVRPGSVRQSTAEVGRRRRRPAPARCVVESRHSTASPPHHYRRLPETHRARRAKQIARPALHRLSSSPTEAAPHRHGSSAFVRFSAGIHRLQRSSTITGSPHQRRSRGSARTASAAGRVRSPVATRRSRTWRWRARAASGCR